MEESRIPLAQRWDENLDAQQGHLLQSWAWGQLKAQFGWDPCRIEARGAAAQVLFRRLPLGLTIAYVPRGPAIDWGDQPCCQALLAAIHAEAKRRRAIFLKVEPDLASADQEQMIRARLLSSGFTPAETIQPQSSIVIDISADEGAILAAMKQKTRYNIRLARRKGVTVRQGAAGDITTFYALAEQTSERDGFGIHSPTYYQAAHQLFTPEQCALLIAEFEGEPLAGLMVFRQGAAATYLYGASSNQHRNLMPAYLIQWEAIRWAKSKGCLSYDLWGIPDADPETLEAEFSQRHDGLWGVYRFKRGFGGRVVQSVGAFDTIYMPMLYHLYKMWRPSA